MLSNLQLKLLQHSDKAFSEGRYSDFANLYTLHASCGELPIYTSAYNGKTILLLAKEWVASIGHICLIDTVLKAFYVGLLPIEIEHIEVHGLRNEIGNKELLGIFPNDVSFILHESIDQYNSQLQRYSKHCSPLPLTVLLLSNYKYYDYNQVLKPILRLYEQQKKKHSLIYSDIRANETCEHLLEKMPYLEKGFATLHVRNGYEGTSRQRAGRNCNVYDYIPTVNMLWNEYGLATIRLGDNKMPPLNLPWVIDLATLDGGRRAMHSFFLANTTIHVGTQSGPLHLPLIMNRPTALTGAVALGYVAHLYYSKLALLPKFWYNVYANRVLSLDEWFSDPRLICSEHRFIQEGNVVLRENSASDICRLARDLLSSSTGTLACKEEGNYLANQMTWKVHMERYNLFSSAIPPEWFCEEYLSKTDRIPFGDGNSLPINRRQN